MVAADWDKGVPITWHRTLLLLFSGLLILGSICTTYGMLW